MLHMQALPDGAGEHGYDEIRRTPIRVVPTVIFRWPLHSGENVPSCPIHPASVSLWPAPSAEIYLYLGSESVLIILLYLLQTPV